MPTPCRSAAASTVSSPSTVNERPLGRTVTLKLIESRMESNRPAPSPPARRGRRKLGRPRLLIIGCGDIGLRIVSRLAARFRLIALTSTPARAARLRAAGIVPIVGDLDHRQSLRRLRGLAPRLVHPAPPPNEGDRDTRTRNLIAAQAGVIERSVYISTSGVY